MDSINWIIELSNLIQVGFTIYVFYLMLIYKQTKRVFWLYTISAILFVLLRLWIVPNSNTELIGSILWGIYNVSIRLSFIFFIIEKINGRNNTH